MSLFLRWTTFNLVGLLGMGVQLGLLFCFNRWLPGHYLVSTAMALELTLLHNFAWHRRLTWRDRTGSNTGHGSGARQLLRFHLTNGLVSLTGNLALMRLLVHTAHLPVLPANAVAILCCSLVNFWLSHAWTFRSHAPESVHQHYPLTLTGVLALSALLLTAATATSQQAPAQGLAERSVPATQVEEDYGVDSAYANVFGGPACTTSDGRHPTGMIGVTLGQYFDGWQRRGLPAAPQLELGLVGPLPGGHPIDGFGSLDYMFSAKLARTPRFLFATIGYTACSSQETQ